MDNLRTKQSNQSGDFNTHAPGDIFSFRPGNSTMSPKHPKEEQAYEYTIKKLPDNFN